MDENLKMEEPENILNDTTSDEQQMRHATEKLSDTTVEKLDATETALQEKQSDAIKELSDSKPLNDSLLDGEDVTKKHQAKREIAGMVLEGEGKKKRYKLRCKNCTCENCPLKEYQKKKQDGTLEEFIGTACKCKPKCRCTDCEYIKRLRALLCSTVCTGDKYTKDKTKDQGKSGPEGESKEKSGPPEAESKETRTPVKRNRRSTSDAEDPSMASNQDDVELAPENQSDDVQHVPEENVNDVQLSVEENVNDVQLSVEEKINDVQLPLDNQTESTNVQYVGVVLPSIHSPLCETNCHSKCKDQAEDYEVDTNPTQIGRETKSNFSEGNKKTEFKPFYKKCSCKECPLISLEDENEDDKLNSLSVIKCDCLPECSCKNCAYIKCVRALLKKCELLCKLKELPSPFRNALQVFEECLRPTDNIVEKETEQNEIKVYSVQEETNSNVLPTESSRESKSSQQCCLENDALSQENITINNEENDNPVCVCKGKCKTSKWKCVQHQIKSKLSCSHSRHPIHLADPTPVCVCAQSCNCRKCQFNLKKSKSNIETTISSNDPCKQSKSPTKPKSPFNIFSPFKILNLKKTKSPYKQKEDYKLAPCNRPPEDLCKVCCSTENINTPSTNESSKCKEHVSFTYEPHQAISCCNLEVNTKESSCSLPSFEPCKSLTSSTIMYVGGVKSPCTCGIACTHKLESLNEKSSSSPQCNCVGVCNCDECKAKAVTKTMCDCVLCKCTDCKFRPNSPKVKDLTRVGSSIDLSKVQNDNVTPPTDVQILKLETVINISDSIEHQSKSPKCKCIDNCRCEDECTLTSSWKPNLMKRETNIETSKTETNDDTLDFCNQFKKPTIMKIETSIQMPTDKESIPNQRESEHPCDITKCKCMYGECLTQSCPTKSNKRDIESKKNKGSKIQCCTCNNGECMQDGCPSCQSRKQNTPLEDLNCKCIDVCNCSPCTRLCKKTKRETTTQGLCRCIICKCKCCIQKLSPRTFKFDLEKAHREFVKKECCDTECCACICGECYKAACLTQKTSSILLDDTMYECMKDTEVASVSEDTNKFQHKLKSKEKNKNENTVDHSKPQVLHELQNKPDSVKNTSNLFKFAPEYKPVPTINPEIKTESEDGKISKPESENEFPMKVNLPIHESQPEDNFLNTKDFPKLQNESKNYKNKPQLFKFAPEFSPVPTINPEKNKEIESESESEKISKSEPPIGEYPNTPDLPNVKIDNEGLLPLPAVALPSDKLNSNTTDLPNVKIDNEGLLPLPAVALPSDKLHSNTTDLPNVKIDNEGLLPLPAMALPSDKLNSNTTDLPNVKIDNEGLLPLPAVAIPSDKSNSKGLGCKCNKFECLPEDFKSKFPIAKEILKKNQEKFHSKQSKRCCKCRRFECLPEDILSKAKKKDKCYCKDFDCLPQDFKTKYPIANETGFVSPPKLKIQDDFLAKFPIINDIEYVSPPETEMEEDLIAKFPIVKENELVSSPETEIEGNFKVKFPIVNEKKFTAPTETEIEENLKAKLPIVNEKQLVSPPETEIKENFKANFPITNELQNVLQPETEIKENSKAKFPITKEQENVLPPETKNEENFKAKFSITNEKEDVLPPEPEKNFKAKFPITNKQDNVLLPDIFEDDVTKNIDKILNQYCNVQKCICTCNQCQKTGCPTKTFSGLHLKDEQTKVKVCKCSTSSSDKTSDESVFECLPDDAKDKFPIGKGKESVSRPSKPEKPKSSKRCKCKDFECVPEDFKRKLAPEMEKYIHVLRKKTICPCKQFECLPEDEKRRIRDNYKAIKKSQGKKIENVCKCIDFNCLPEIKSDESIENYQCIEGKCLNKDCLNRKKSLPTIAYTLSIEQLRFIENTTDLLPITVEKPLNTLEIITNESEVEKQINTLHNQYFYGSESSQISNSEIITNEDVAGVSGPCKYTRCKCESCTVAKKSSDNKNSD